jgi:hypothetical protein
LSWAGKLWFDEAMDRSATLGFVTSVSIGGMTRHLADATPDWAHGVLRSKAAASQEPAMESIQVSPQHDDASDLTYFSVPGFHVAVIDPPIQRSLQAGFDLVRRLCAPHPLDVGMLALPDGISVPAALVNQLAGHSVMVSRLRANSALSKARLEVDRFLELQRKGQANLEAFGLNRAIEHASREAASM